MELINSYFAGLIFRYVETKQSYSIYAASIYSRLGGDKQRYVFAFVQSHLGILSTAKLSDLPWVNFQVRMCPSTSYNLKSQGWSIPYSSDNPIFVAVSREQNYTVYESEGNVIPLKMFLIHNPKKKSIYQYPQKVNLHWAIEQFSTVLQYDGQSQTHQSNFELI